LSHVSPIISKPSFSARRDGRSGGNHTDHQHGRVLCAFVDLDIIAVSAPNQDGIIRLQSKASTTWM
jgi:galactokinase